jgi:hypothetical protein
LTGRERIDATREAGGTVVLWPDGVDFEIDLRGVADKQTAEMLLDVLSDISCHSEILEQLKREQAEARA